MVKRKKGLLNAHQVIFFYSKTDKFTFNPIYNGYSEATNIDQIFQKRKRDANGKTVYRTSELTLSVSNTPNDQLYVYNTIDAIIRNKNVLTER